MNLVIFITAASRKEAKKIAEALVERKLAACVNTVFPVASVFSWKGKIERCRESLLIVKTARSRFKALLRLVKSLHSYEVPEIIALPIIEGNQDYLEWLNAAVRQSP